MIVGVTLTSFVANKQIPNKKGNIIGLKAITLNAFQKRTFLKDALYGSFAFIEGTDTLYQIIILTGGTSISKLADKLESSIMSFKEL